MRKTQGQGRRPSDRIVLRAGHGTERIGSSRTATPAARALRPSVEPRKLAANAAPRGEATMDYQMGFTSGSSI